ncbi:MAG: carboxylating nicotinate-nucleotide diphosphorylase, partial [Bacillota bacterium]
MNLTKNKLKKIIETALREDIRTGDVTTEALIANQQTNRAVIKAKEAGIIAGLEVAELVFQSLDQ